MSVVMDLGASVRRAGVRKVVLTNGHGGNVALLNVAARRLRVEHGLLAVCCHYPFLPLPEGLWPAEELRFGIHAGGVETSMMAHLQPSLVRCVSQRPLACTRSDLCGPQVRWEHARPFPSKAEDCAAEHELLFPHGPAVNYGWMAQDLNEAGAVGDASDADAERGATVVAHYGDALAKLLQEVGGVDADTLLKKLTARSGGT